ncbi:MAG: hypothetical protein KatS3mg105_0472 [Gemmatales bacterium]|nr:MAG: hypothetical protein KatS3mg105_0472 [Gemmatales bacterium]
MIRRILVAVLTALVPATAWAQKQFGFDNRKPSGQPYLEAEESARRMKVPKGFEVKVFAAEPDIVNPIAFTVDERGRLWVVECYEYPKRTPRGKMPRDRIKILEDADGDGKAEKVTVWAEGKDFPMRFDMASGIEVGYGGVFLGAPPYLYFLRDTDGDGKCDKHEVLLKGFGSQDTHETLNTFQWGPDGLLYGLHGVFTHSEVQGIKMNAAVWRFHFPAKKFEIFAEGTSNPWGMDFDQHGQCFLACCVIPHLFHMIPGATYKRQAGSSFNPYAYGLLDEICDHTHHRESGWAHAGLIVMQGDHVPKAYRDSIIMGSIHGCSIKRDTLRRNGSTFRAGHADDFLVSGDKNFRPINLRWGPDGSIFVIDWHDQNPCHQAHPDSWDKKRGRVYKIQRSNLKSQPTPDLAKRSSKQLVELLKNDNPWWYRTALRLLKERQDKSVRDELLELAHHKKAALALRGVWGLFAIGAFDEKVAFRLLEHPSPWVRSWAIRLAGEAGRVSDKMLARLTDLAATENAAEVRLQLASTAGRLTEQDTIPLLQNLMNRKEDANDPCLPLMIWWAYEPQLKAEGEKPARRDAALGWLQENAAGNPIITRQIVPRTMRRLIASGDREDLAACVRFLAQVEGEVRLQALQGMVQALQQRQVDPPKEWTRTAAVLLKDKNPAVRKLAQRLAVNFRDSAAIRRSLADAANGKLAPEVRIEAIRDLALAHPTEALGVLLKIVGSEKNIDVAREACRALSAYESPEIAKSILAGWKNYPELMQQEAVHLLAGRKAWARQLLEAVGRKRVQRTALGNNTILRIRAFRDPSLNELIEKVWGRFRDTPAELQKLLVRMRGELDKGPASFARGRKVFEMQCAKCHKFDGKGANVGPNLDGAARDIDYILVNVLDPNRVVGQPYYLRVAELKNGRVEVGLLAAEDDQSVTLKTENDVLKKILKKDIEGQLMIQEKSVMPEGLGENMSVQNFRDLVRYLMAHPYLTEVEMAGPFTGAQQPTVDPNNPLTAPLKWTKPVVGVPGRIPLPPAKTRQAVVHLVAEVTASQAMQTRLQLGAAHRVEAWINGRRVYAGKPASKPIPDTAGADVSLQAGLNRLYFKIIYDGEEGSAFYARLLDPQRRLKQKDFD